MLAFWLVAAFFPVLILLAIGIDLVRPGSKWSTTRLTVFLLCFLFGENVGLLLLFVTWLLTPANSRARAERTFATQRLYTAWHLRCVTWAFSLSFVIKGSEHARPGPLLIFCRHASLVDVLIPGGFIANAHLLELRYVLKNELLIEPCLDVAGHWIPNHFVDRGGKDTDAELAAIAALKANLGQNEGVIIYPEGTRFSRSRRERMIDTLEGDAKSRAVSLRHLHPVRPGGATALLAAAPRCDVLFVGHHGLEGLTRLQEIWRGALVGKTITVQFWREKAEDVPVAPEAQLAWINARWQRIDDWLETFE